jgi:hypothetical protein
MAKDLKDISEEELDLAIRALRKLSNTGDKTEKVADNSEEEYKNRYDGSVTQKDIDAFQALIRGMARKNPKFSYIVLENFSYGKVKRILHSISSYCTKKEKTTVYTIHFEGIKYYVSIGQGEDGVLFSVTHADAIDNTIEEEYEEEYDDDDEEDEKEYTNNNKQSKQENKTVTTKELMELKTLIIKTARKGSKLNFIYLKNTSLSKLNKTLLSIAVSCYQDEECISYVVWLEGVKYYVAIQEVMADTISFSVAYAEGWDKGTHTAEEKRSKGGCGCAAALIVIIIIILIALA